jgi:adenosine kinase
VTLGEKGSVVKNGSEVIEIKAAKANKVLDPTGAGDAYRSGFLAGYMKNLPLKTCGQMGSIASCYAIEKYGTSNHRFSLEEFKSRYKENFEEELSL